MKGHTYSLFPAFPNPHSEKKPEKNHLDLLNSPFLRFFSPFTTDVFAVDSQKTVASQITDSCKTKQLRITTLPETSNL
jgi:hypothetical protein